MNGVANLRPEPEDRAEDELMNTEVIVMIVSLLLPNGHTGVHVTPFTSIDKCVEAANLETSDPFVQKVECSGLEDGILTIRFAQNSGEPV